ncbi:rhomboid family intramembrane serine protease [Fulvivirga ligni]|uniref:rhomboid family intramembrane serine protease n=1 Tax=Fulvivirga ligni TaxID=2904246 RepID=UPI001F32D4DD|nr:rhomboid family intramembrane serine protease [Fulvivirga ligni]UII22245.1 rhomboid family intramembrane serine protease [Fulvivirga ligni]
MIRDQDGKPIPLLTYLLLTLNVGVFVLQVILEDNQSDVITMIHWGANFSPYTLGSEWWRLFSSAFLHFGIVHLLMNMLALYSLGRNLEPHIGSWNFAGLYFISALFAGIASLFWNLYVVSAGASGALFGLFGFLMTFMVIIHWNDKVKLRNIVVSFVVYIVIINLVGSSFQFDNAAHMGGLLAGIILGLFYAYSVHRKRIIFYWTTVIILTLTGVIYFSLLPREKEEYFDVFQELVKTERASNNIMNGNYSSDAVFLKDMNEYMPHWDTLLWQIDSLHNLPEVLISDYDQIKKYAEDKALEMQYTIYMIEKESYTYFDSLDIVRDGLTLNLEYPLAMESASEPRPDSAVQKPSSGEVAKVYYDKNWKETQSYLASYYRLGYKDSLGRWNGPVRDYFRNGAIQMKGTYKKGIKDGVFLYYTEDSVYSAVGRYQNEDRVGKWEEFHKNGSLAQEVRYAERSYLINAWNENGDLQVSNGEGDIIKTYDGGIIASYQHFTNGLKDSLSFGYYANGQPYFKEFFDQGRLTKGISYSKDGEMYEYDASIYQPYPQGGYEKFQAYLTERIESLPNSFPKGAVELLFDVDKKGNVYNIRVYSSDDHELSEMAMEILQNGPKWEPGREHGINPVLSGAYHRFIFP